MILDSGTCTISAIKNTAEAGNLPNQTLVKISDHWFGDLSFESSPFQHTESLEQVEIVRRIRILQDRSVMNKAVVTIGTDQYQVERIFHGSDTESGELISDMNLSKVVAAYVT